MLGTDIVEIIRIKEMVHGQSSEAFLRRVFTEQELKYCYNAPKDLYKYHSLAARFAAKEAVMKVLGEGMSKVDWKDIEVCRLTNGKPFIKLSGKALTLAKKHKFKRIEISLSHTENYATAVALAI